MTTYGLLIFDGVLLHAFLSVAVMLPLLVLGGWLMDRLLTPPARYEEREQDRHRHSREQRQVQAVDEIRARRDQRTRQCDAESGARAA